MESILLSCPPSYHRQAVKDLQRETLMLNELQFNGQIDFFLGVLEQVAVQLTDLSGVRPVASPSSGGDTNTWPAHSSATERGKAIAEALLLKCSRTTSGADSYFAVQVRY